MNAAPAYITPRSYGGTHISAASAPQRENFVLGCVVVPLAHDLFGIGVVQGGEGLVGELANQVFVAVYFKGVE